MTVAYNKSCNQALAGGVCRVGRGAHGHPTTTTTATPHYVSPDPCDSLGSASSSPLPWPC
ncbi:hypothetical protein E2C01_093765 [Portunus trituberculatus]|uniref:Uncharacterized protein n=1 Tax=Portunus trituberculatus TaxID=210409 RepID=A0A5B7JVQ5_PORTR|nr:hypothetical protein [Portunus trituberculatus]